MQFYLNSSLAKCANPTCSNDDLKLFNHLESISCGAQCNKCQKFVCFECKNFFASLSNIKTHISLHKKK